MNFIGLQRDTACSPLKNFKAIPATLSYDLPHLSSPMATKRMGSLPILSPLATQDRYSSLCLARPAAMSKEKNNSSSCFSWRANNRCSAFHGSNRAANNPSIFCHGHTEYRLSLKLSPKLGKYWGKSWGFSTLQPLFKMAFYTMISEDEQIDSEVV